MAREGASSVRQVNPIQHQCSRASTTALQPAWELNRLEISLSRLEVSSFASGKAPVATMGLPGPALVNLLVQCPSEALLADLT